jgi:hypothetical protein
VRRLGTAEPPEGPGLPNLRQRILEELLLGIATPAEARKMLGLKGAESVAF